MIGFINALHSDFRICNSKSPNHILDIYLFIYKTLYAIDSMNKKVTNNFIYLKHFNEAGWL